MIFRESFIELYINGVKVELESQESLNLRLNNTLIDPTKISSTQAEYSFEFEVPATAKNNKIFDYANNLGKLNKFHQRYNAEVYADGALIFSGTITINSYKDKKYSLNLVNAKTYSLEDIFGDATMDKIGNWKIDFSGVTSINQLNGELEADVVFPFVSYGAFQKSPYNSDEVANDYTSKFDIDQYNKWYVESFFPSANVLKTVKKAFEWKGYKVGGDAFENPYLSSIYASTNLAEGQDPQYNVGNPNFGKVDLSVSFTTSQRGYQQELSFPYYGISARFSNTTFTTERKYNFSSVNIFNILEGANMNQSISYMYQPNESLIVIPADGFYKIDMDVSCALNSTADITVCQYTRHQQAEEELYEEDITVTPGLSEITPLEIQLIRNYSDNIELIKGKHNTTYVNGNPNDVLAWGSQANADNWETCYPHEDPYNSQLPTEKNDLSFRNTKSRSVGRNRIGNGGTRSTIGNERHSSFSTSDRYYSPLEYGYVYNDGEIMAYDQVVSPAFICGFSSMKGGVMSVMKNGYSWSNSTAEKNEAFYPEIGYSKLSRQAGTGDLLTEQTTHNQNSYINAPISRVQANESTMTGSLSCMVYLRKNDVLELVAVQREYHTRVGNDVTYSTTSNVNLKIEAASPRSYYDLQTARYTYESATEFDTQLNIPNFFNNETKVSDWIQDILNAFNLDITQYGDTVEINTKKKSSDLLIAVDIDDRTNYSEAESQKPDYPKSMCVRYKIDTDEWGAERSAVMANGGDESILNNESWKNSIDSGYTVIALNDDTYVTSTSELNLPFSYTWYQDFDWYTVNEYFQKTSDTPVRINIPCISKYSYMIDGYSYDESMKHDGYGLAQRFWFRPRNSGCYVYTRTYPAERVFLYEPTNTYTNYQDVYMNLSYKNTEKSLLTEFFNVTAFLSSNYVIIDVYLTAEEYNRIRNGSLVAFDQDIYLPVEITGFDPTGGNETTLKLLKKVN